MRDQTVRSPDFSPRDEILFEDYQSTLDRYRGEKELLEDIQDIESSLDEFEIAGVIGYGSLFQGKGILPNSHLKEIYTDHSPYNNFSDIDAVLLIEDNFHDAELHVKKRELQEWIYENLYPDREFKEEFLDGVPDHTQPVLESIDPPHHQDPEKIAAEQEDIGEEYFREIIRNLYDEDLVELDREGIKLSKTAQQNMKTADNRIDRHYWVYTHDGFLNKIRAARADWYLGHEAEFFLVPEHARNEEEEIPSEPLTHFARTLYTGYVLPRGGSSSLEKEIEDTKDMILDQNGRIADEFMGEGATFDVLAYHREKQERQVTREEVLERNVEMRNMSEGMKKLDPSLETGENPEEFNLEDFVLQTLSEQISEEELARLYTGTLPEPEYFKLDDKERLSSWVDGLDERVESHEVSRKIRKHLLADKNICRERWENDESGRDREKWGNRSVYRADNISLDDRSNPHIPTELEYLSKLGRARIQEKLGELDSVDLEEYTGKKTPELTLKDLIQVEEEISGRETGRSHAPEEQHKLSDFS